MFDSLSAMLTVFEADVPHMYLDAKGNVTVGIGHLLPTVRAAYGLPFLLPNGLPAEQADILNDYRAIKQSQPGRLASYYAQIADLRLKPEDRQVLLSSDILRTHASLVAMFDEFPFLPAPAQDALLNMAFELGPRGLMQGYPKLIAACMNGDWKTAAAECFISAAQSARNEANKNLFLSI